MKSKIHNLGISFSLDGLALSHSVWSDKTLILQDFWVSKDKVSIDLLISKLTEIAQSWSQTEQHKIYFFSPNKLVQLRLKEWADAHLDPFSYRILPPVAPASDSVVYLVSLMNDGSIAVHQGIDLEAVKNALRGISEDEGEAIGSPEGLSLLYSLAEPSYRVLNTQLPPIFDRILPVKREAYDLPS